MNYQSDNSLIDDALLSRHARQLFSIGTWEYDSRQDQFCFDESSRAILGVNTQSLSLKALIGRVIPEDRRVLVSALQTDSEFDRRLTINRPNGTRRKLRIRGELATTDTSKEGPQDSDNEYEYEISSFHGVIQDVTAEANQVGETDTTEQQGALPFHLFAEQFRSVLEQADLALWRWDIERNEIRGNDRWLATIDIDRPADFIKPAEWLASIHPDDRDTVEQFIERRGEIASKNGWNVEYRSQGTNGEWSWRESIGQVVKRDNDGNATHAIGIVRRIDDRKETEKLLREERDLFAAGPTVVFRWRTEPNWPIEYVSSNVAELLGYTPDELQAGKVEYSDLVHPDDRERVRGEVSRASNAHMNHFGHEPYRLLSKSGDVRWVLDYTTIIRDDEGVNTHNIGYLVDITDQKLREQKRDRLNEAAQELLTYQSKEALFATVRAATGDIFESEWVETYHYDSEQEALIPTPSSENDHTIGPGEHPLWDLFVAGEQTTIDAETLPTPCPEGIPPAETLAVFPLGGHGLCLRSEGETNEQMDELEDLLAAMAGVTLDRVEETTQRINQTDGLRSRVEHLETLTDLYGTVYSLLAAIVETNSRKETYRTICETLNTIDKFGGVWIGKPDGDELIPVAQAGLSGEFFDDHPRKRTAGTPAARAARERQVIEVPQIPEHLQREPWRAGALAHNLRSALSIPLEQGDIFHGTLTVYETETGAFNDELCEILTDLATVASYLINLRERYETVRGERIVELTFEVELSDQSPLAKLAGKVNGDILIENLVQGQPNAWLAHCRVEDTEAVVNAGRTIPNIERIDRLNEQTVEILTVDDRVLTGVASLGAEFDSLTLGKDIGTLVIRVEDDHRVRDLAGTVKDLFERVTLEAKHHSDVMDVETERPLLTSSLTDRQETILRTAYYSGYFDRKRTRTGTEIAETLGIAQPTFSNHIRAAQRNLLEAAFGPRTASIR